MSLIYWGALLSIVSTIGGFLSKNSRKYELIFTVLAILGTLLMLYSAQQAAEREKYLYFATLNMNGAQNSGSAAFATPVTVALGTVIDEFDGKVTINKCDFETLNKVIADFPQFPFAYYIKAACLRRDGKETWKESAHQALDILKITTHIDGHAADHDSALSRLNNTFARGDSLLFGFEAPLLTH